MRDYKKRDTFVDKYDKIVNLSIKELEYIRSRYNWQLRIAVGLIILTVLCAFFLISDQFSGYQKILDDKFSEILSSTKDEQDSLYQSFITETNQKIEKLIAKNFSDKEILKLMKLVATEKVDSFTNQYLDKLVEQRITPKLKSVSAELSNVDTKIQFIELHLYKVAAHNDDRISFDKLIDISKDKTNKYHNSADQVVQSLISKYAQNIVPRKHPTLRTTERDENFTWSINDCKNWFFNYPKDDRIAILENVFEIKRFNDKEKTELALIVVKGDESLTVVRKASIFLVDKFGLPYKSLEINNIIMAMKDKGYK